MPDGNFLNVEFLDGEILSVFVEKDDRAVFVEGWIGYGPKKIVNGRRKGGGFNSYQLKRYWFTENPAGTIL